MKNIISKLTLQVSYSINSIQNALFHIGTEMPKGGVRHKAGQLPWPPLAKIQLYFTLYISR